jgi:hypothetical protein
LSFLDHILSADFSSETFLEEKIEINRVNLTPCQSMETYTECPWVALEVTIFLAFITHANEG